MSYRDDLSLKVATANSLELVALQYEAIIENINDYKSFMMLNDKDNASKKLEKIRDIIANLITTLGNEKTEFREKTVQLYLYINRTLNESYINSNLSKLDDIIFNLTSLKEAWQEASKKFPKNSDSKKGISNAVTYGKKDININGSTTDFGSI